jgi:hypothetical protein
MTRRSPASQGRAWTTAFSPSVVLVVRAISSGAASSSHARSARACRSIARRRAQPAGELPPSAASKSRASWTASVILLGRAPKNPVLSQVRSAKTGISARILAKEVNRRLLRDRLVVRGVYQAWRRSMCGHGSRQPARLGATRGLCDSPSHAPRASGRARCGLAATDRAGSASGLGRESCGHRTTTAARLEFPRGTTMSDTPRAERGGCTRAPGSLR